MTLIIAEAGVNHNGDEKLAFQLVDAAYHAGADIVKFQTFKAKNLVTSQAQQADYQVKNSAKEESQLMMLQRLELGYDSHLRLQAYCNQLGIEFLSTAFDSESLHFLVHELRLKRLKIASGEITNTPFILEHAQSGLDLILSTGMATLCEIESALAVIAFGYTASVDVPPSMDAFQSAYRSEQGKALLRKRVTLLHCTTEYPAPLSSVNLKAIDTLAQRFQLNVGYSDHTAGIAVSIGAVARGAQVVEKHFTLDKTMQGPDHQASLEPAQLAEMVTSIRAVELALGSGVKRPQLVELKNSLVARKSLVAATNISKGERLSAANIAIKRPGSGMSPNHYWALLGRVCKSSYLEGDLIDE